MIRNVLFRLAVTVLPTVVGVTATTIDFEAQGTSAPSAFNGVLNSPLTIGIVTFTGGQLLKNETFGTPSADTTVVYATNGFLAGYTDPLVITFSQPVGNVSLLVTNETPDTYTLTDNAGHSSSLVIGNNVSQTLSLTDTGVTRVTIATNATVGWDFAIDNVTFTPSVPEPSALAYLGVFLVGGFGLCRRARGRSPAR